jgi:hypothetical protein
VISAAEDDTLAGVTVEFVFTKEREQLVRESVIRKRQQIIGFFNTDEQIGQFSIRTTVFDNHANYLSYLGETPTSRSHQRLTPVARGTARRDLRTRINRPRSAQWLEHQFMENKIRKEPAPKDPLFQHFVGLSSEVSDGEDEPDADDRLNIHREQLEQRLDDVLRNSIPVPRKSLSEPIRSERLSDRVTSSEGVNHTA